VSIWSTGITDLGMTSAEADGLCYCRGAVGGVGPHPYHGAPRHGIDYTDPGLAVCSNPPESCSDAGCPVHGWDYDDGTTP
jgi:hypothetical protein